MLLEVGKSSKCHFYRFLKKTNIFECFDNGMVIEREKGQVTLYVTDDRCSKIYAIIPLGSDKFLRRYKVVAINYNEHVFLVDAGFCYIVIDFEAQKVAVSDPNVKARGSKFWGEEVQEPWLEDYGAMFGLSV